MSWAGKYRLEHTLGAGGMGTVIAATHLGLGRRVALKFMRLGAPGDGAALARFMREARALATLRSEHVAQVMDVELDAQNGAPYIVMEYLEGRDLASMLESSGVPPVTEAVGYVLQACEGLAEAHANGIVHRDLKPANLFLTRRPDDTPLVKVLDFGVSKLEETASSGAFRLTQPREALGSPEYMSPEQIVASPNVDARADVWALGVILYELLTGKPPFTGATFLELGLAITNRAPPQLVRQLPGLAPGLITIVDRCLQKSPAARFPDLANLAAALAPHGGPDAERSARRIARTLGVPASASGRLESTRAGRSRWLAVGGLLSLALLGGAVAAGVVLQRRPAERPAASAAPPLPAPAPRSPAARPPDSVASTPPPPRAEPPSPRPRAARRHHRPPDDASPIVATPPSEHSSVEGATRTRRGPVVTDL